MDLIDDSVFGTSDTGVVSDVCYDQGYGSNLDFLTEPSYGIGTEPSYETKNEDSPISYGNGNNFLSYGQPQEVNIYGNNLQYSQNQNQQTNQHLHHQQNQLFPEQKNEPEPEEVRLEDDPEFQNSKPQVTISNVVTNFRCRCHLNLRVIAQKTKHVIYKRDQGKLMMKMRTPPMMANIWSSGKVVCQGAKSEQDAKKGSRTFARMIQQSGFPNVKVSNYKVVNVLGNCRVPFALDIMQFSVDNSGPNLTYEPELHPAVNFRPGNGATLKIFSTGALTILGKNVETVEKALEMSYPLLYPYRRDSQQDENEVEKDLVNGQEEFDGFIERCRSGQRFLKRIMLEK
ncbi:Oidioi.mRNA.OKI2018_I69.chr2.g6786.t1.cds [Oikopleura dioica]|uniref:Oidioi.mRNA.OKI2018_I69.chr2.g6786.t1.cds n=1 Tax=Oikopleura dioica TaxID=34765 RepID=A0ABN7T6F7_OIKDI|nr:Oidioi.mRNA.OKI2018_I69.chr2.g6786.t1.cds [Oikopleura dioica]